jgi:uncharacterized membrane protein YebE (DUF533 family)
MFDASKILGALIDDKASPAPAADADTSSGLLDGMPSIPGGTTGKVLVGAAGVAAAGGLAYMAYRHFKQPEPGAPGAPGAAPQGGGGMLGGILGSPMGQAQPAGSFGVPTYAADPSTWGQAAAPAAAAPPTYGSYGAPQPAAPPPQSPQSFGAPAAQPGYPASPYGAPPGSPAAQPGYPASPYGAPPGSPAAQPGYPASPYGAPAAAAAPGYPASPYGAPASPPGAPAAPGQGFGGPAASPFAAAAPPAQAADPQADSLLLVRAMISTAAIDGQIDPTERQRIVDRATRAGLAQAELEALGRELDAPVAPYVLLGQVRSRELAEQLYVVSLLAVQVDNEAEKTYLRALPLVLGMRSDEVARLHARLGVAPF